MIKPERGRERGNPVHTRRGNRLYSQQIELSRTRIRDAAGVLILKRLKLKKTHLDGCAFSLEVNICRIR